MLVKKNNLKNLCAGWEAAKATGNALGKSVCEHLLELCCLTQGARCFHPLRIQSPESSPEGTS